MAILYSWISDNEYRALSRENFQNEYLINNICEFPSVEIGKVYLFVSSSTYQTQSTQEMKLYPDKLKSYWQNNYENDLKEICQKHNIDYYDEEAIRKETNYFFKSELNTFNKIYSRNNRKGEIDINVLKLPVNIDEKTYFSFIYNTYIKSKQDKEIFFLFSPSVGEDIKSYVADLIFGFGFKRFPRFAKEEKEANDRISRGYMSEMDIFDWLDLDKDEIFGSDKGPKYFIDILTNDNVIKGLKIFAEEIAKTNFSVLILGESGTGKELFAKAIHNASQRSSKPFYAINCGAIPNDLLESELFGHEKGSFTGALKQKKGLFELADRGTIFLDEIGDMSLFLQTKLLRAIDSRKIRRVGGDEEINVDIRFIYATNMNLYQRVKEKEFRDDLYYRINVLNINIPTLRDRVKSDIDLIMTSEVLEKYPQYNKYKFDKSAKELLYDYNWPGNVRQLKSVIIRSLLYSIYLKRNIDKNIIETSIGQEALNDYYIEKKIEAKPFEANYIMPERTFINKETTSELYIEINKTLLIKGFDLKTLLENIEKEYIAEALNLDKTQPDAGRRLGYSQQKISQKVKKYNIHKFML